MSNRLKPKPKKEIKVKQPVYNLTAAQIKQMKEEATKNAIDTAFMLLLAIPISVMHDKYDWGKIRCERLVDQLLDRYECYSKGYVTLEELRQWLFEESGIKIEGESSR